MARALTRPLLCSQEDPDWLGTGAYGSHAQAGEPRHTGASSGRSRRLLLKRALRLATACSRARSHSNTRMVRLVLIAGRHSAPGALYLPPQPSLFSWIATATL